MDKDNPAVYECPESKSGLHHWYREYNEECNKYGIATCKNCKLVLSLEHTRQVFDDITIIGIDYGIDHG